MKFRILDSARKELRGAFAHYIQIRLELGLNSKDAVNAAFDRIEMWPLSCAKVFCDVRICRIKRCPSRSGDRCRSRDAPSPSPRLLEETVEGN
jgi:hypothetical protein